MMGVISSLKLFFEFGVKKIGLKYFHHLQMIEYSIENIHSLQERPAKNLSFVIRE